MKTMFRLQKGWLVRLALVIGRGAAIPSAIAATDHVRLVVQLGHPGVINSVAFSPDGHWLVTGSIDTTVRLWEVATGREVRQFIDMQRS